MDLHYCKTIIITCIDFRFQDIIDKWLDKNFRPKTYDRVAFAGGVLNLDVDLKQIKIAHQLHHIKEVVLINHEDCGAYGKEGSFEKHAEDLIKASKKIKLLFPKLDVKTFYLHLDGTFEEIKAESSVKYPLRPHFA